MDTTKDFIIPFKGLSSGSHTFRFEIDDEFFESFEYFESERGNLLVDLELIKESAHLELIFKIEGNIKLECDRCLEEMIYPVTGGYRLIVKFGDEYGEESDEIVVIPLSESRIDIGQYVFEYINMLLPIQRVHEDEEMCDQKVIDKLHKHSKQQSDPRWEALKGIKNKLK